jgi:hypothetical protein
VKAAKVAYKPVGLALGALSGVIAGAAFKQAWKMLGHDEDAPDEDRTWQEVMLACHPPGGDLRRGQGRRRPRRRHRHTSFHRHLARLTR